MTDIYIDRLTPKQRKHLAQWILGRFPTLNSQELIAILELALKQARANRRKTHRMWATFPHEVDVIREADHLTLDKALLAVRDGMPDRYGAKTSISTLRRRYRQEKQNTRCTNHR